jgi:hypothetical protein
MRYLIISFLLYSCSVFCQFYNEIEPNEYLKNYESVIVIHGSKGKTNWSSKYIFENGLIKKRFNFNKSKLTYEQAYYYNQGKLDFIVVLFNINKGKTNDTIKFTYKYNNKNQLIYDDVFVEKYYSNFNEKNLPQTIEYKSLFDSISGYKKELKYDIKGNISEEKIYSKVNNQFIIETVNYIYNSKNCIIEINRSSLPKSDYPIMVLGGRFLYENEQFRYVYNKYNIWIKKFIIINGVEYLYTQRKFKKRKN